MLERVNQISKTIPAANDVELVPFNGSRIGLILSPPASGAYEINLMGAAAIGGGIRVPAGSQALQLDGTRAQLAVRAIADTNPVTVGVTEILGK